MAADADVVFHLAGVNRPVADEEFTTGNAVFTESLVSALRAAGRAPVVLFASSMQAELDNPYGASKRAAEEILRRYAHETNARVVAFRLPNVFGKWSRAYYNSVVATFCHSIARDQPITISDPGRELELVYIDDVVAAFVDESRRHGGSGGYTVAAPQIPTTIITLEGLADLVRSFRRMRDTLLVPDLSATFTRQLYATYLSHVEPHRWQYELEQRADERGELTEWIKSSAFGQIFVSRTRPGVTRGNHFHHTKTEKFFVVAGEALIRFRPVTGGEVVEFRVRGSDARVVDIPPGFTHSITNIGREDLVTLFWASEIFEPSRPDTIYEPVNPDQDGASR